MSAALVNEQAARPPLLVVERLSKSYGSTVALQPTDLCIHRGEFVTLLGPSGCGKSTLLRMVCGVTEATAGAITLGGRRIEHLPPERRDIAMVFQTYALFPHLSVRKNLDFGLRMKKVAPQEQARRLAHAVEICNLGDLLGRMPRQLSGGQQQRVALARAVVMQPALMLFDEPLSNLDAKLRDNLRDELVRLHRAAGTTSLYVTHDQAEAMAMSDRVMVMNAGRIVEGGTPLALYRRPRHAFTATFLGQTNLLTVPLEQGVATLPWGQNCPIENAEPAARQALVSLRPEDLALRPDPQGPGQIVLASFVGATVHYTLRLGGLMLRASHTGAAPLLPEGTRIGLQAAAPVLQALQAPADTSTGGATP
jgi:putative spermidine/putrescine transport system ATP-binding protein